MPRARADVSPMSDSPEILDTPKTLHTEVLIAGGGMVGLTLGIALASALMRLKRLWINAK